MTILPKTIVQKLGSYQAPPEGRLPFARLDFNENTVGFSETFDGLDKDFPFNVYPEYGQAVRLFAEVFGVNPGNLLFTNGSDEGIAVIASTFIEPGVDTAVLSSPTFFGITHSLSLAGAELKQISVNPDLSFNTSAIENALAQSPKIAMFASPDNPTGATLDTDLILRWCKQYPNTLFAVDEAYAEYSEHSLLPFVANYDNLLVLRTFSKAWGLAGLRLGLIIGREELIGHLKVVRLPYSVNSVAISSAMRLLAERDRVQSLAKKTMERKNTLIAALRKRGYKVIEGAGNFFLLGVGFNAQELADYLQLRGILVRNRSQGSSPSEHVLWGFVRVTVGSEEENVQLLQAVDSFNSQYAVSFDLDGTLVDTSESYDRTIDLLVKKHSGSGLNNGELMAIRMEGSFNNDWDALDEILTRRGIKVPREQLEDEALTLYFELAKKHERLMILPELLSSIAKRHPVFIVTGRTRIEYEPLWAKTFDSLCERVYCADDIPGALPKPAPDVLQSMLTHSNASTGVYVGNSVDDMKAAEAAGLKSIGITSTLPGQNLRNAGAQIVLESPNLLDKVFLL
ncbi:MAG: hypothetical protein C5B53_04650 [Candidatus Melainabacteria bacterium]|nr:MAG: hypothetical protein C5B53_04650 [Candidatus Melainabacteria bacterium]